MSSANKLYQLSGTSLSFKDWLEREKSKGKFIPNANAMEEFKNADAVDNQEKETNTPLIRNVAIIGVVLILGLYLYNKSK